MFYVFLVLAFAILLIAGLWPQLTVYSFGGFNALSPTLATAFLVLFLGCVLMLTTQTRLVLILGLGAVGYSIGLIFALNGAPDLALTQIAVESLTVLLFALALRNYPPLKRFAFQRRLQAATIVSCVFAFGLFLLTAGLLNDPQMSRLSDYYLRVSVPEAFGTNVVNVILVDFRGFDTFGEICVLAIAGIGIYCLLTGLKNERGTN